VSYDVRFSLEALDDVLRITMASQARAAVIQATGQLQEVLKDNPAEAGEHLSEGLYYIDCEPLRAYYSIDDEELSVEIVNVKQV
jgi:hypothetical protein